MEVREIHSGSERSFKTERLGQPAIDASLFPFFVGNKTICAEMETKGFYFELVYELFILELHPLHVSEG